MRSLPLLVLGALAGEAGATSIERREASTPYPGVTLEEIRTADPACDVVAVYVDLCHDHVHVDATGPAERLRSTRAWAESVGAQVAANGDFYRTGPVRVYGDAVGGGRRWPAANSGVDGTYSWEWYHQRYGWIAFGPGWADFTHTRWVKESSPQAEAGQALLGWAPDEVAPAPPDDTLALVSGFPELVTEGVVRTCADPRSDACFPDRGDMKDRHPRTAMGLTEDRGIFLLIAVDGRSARSAGMRGAELAWLMGELGAWQAFNLDGGGSTQLWLEDGGYANAAGNRAVANHWAVFAGEGGGRARTPGHCPGRPAEPPDPPPDPCPPLPAEGGALDDAADSGCLELFGPERFWRTVDPHDDAHGGSLRWTNAFVTDEPSNWARWSFRVAEAGEYRLQWHAVDEFAVFDEVRHVVRPAGEPAVALEVDQGAAPAGWNDLGVFWLDADEAHAVELFDDGSAPIADDSHIVVDGLRVVPVEEPPPGVPDPPDEPPVDPPADPTDEPPTDPPADPPADPPTDPPAEPEPIAEEPDPAVEPPPAEAGSGGKEGGVGCRTTGGWPGPILRR